MFAEQNRATSGGKLAKEPDRCARRDVVPILRQNCIGCHGPSQQISGLRLDRRSAVLSRKGVVPGSSANSFLYHRISGTEYGMQMPPTGPLRAEQISTLKTW